MALEPIRATLAASFSVLGTLPAAFQVCAVQHAKLIAGDAAAEDTLGFEAALDGDTAVLGAPGDNNDVGAAYVFSQQGGVWTEQAKLVPSDGLIQDDFGRAVAIDGDLVVVGSRFGTGVASDTGAAYVYQRSGTSWSEIAKLAASDGVLADYFGSSVAIDGSTIAVGAHLVDAAGGMDAGAVYVFVNSGSSWSEQAKLSASDGAVSDIFGVRIALEGDRLAIAAIDDDDNGTNSGSVYVFGRVGTTWGEVQKLKASDGSPFDRFGLGLTLEAPRLLVGAGDAGTSGGFQPGAVYVFGESNGTWGEEQILTASDLNGGDEFGVTVSLAGDTALIGAPGNDDQGSASGSAYVFEFNGIAWIETTKILPNGAAGFHRFGSSVWLDGRRGLLGAPGDHNAGNETGAGYVFELDPTVNNYCTAGISASGCQPVLTASGVASATAPTGFTVTASPVEGNKDGLFFFGTNGRQAVNWGTSSSKYCLVSPVSRGGLLSGGGTTGQCNGGFAYDLNARWTQKPNQNPGPGAMVQVQFWYRDPLNTSNQSTSLTGAIEASVCP